MKRIIGWLSNIRTILKPRYLIIILVAVAVGFGGYALARYQKKIKASKAEAQHEETFKQICQNGGRTYYREYIKAGKNGQQELREGCR